ncbi:MAG TPA: hypothetical protein VFM54_23005 [Micromonosporaceae bacterium]|nr:hypothetical protein [Micromonosporaceae bacterium]
MRHLWSLIAGVVLAPLAWGLLAIGQPQSSETIAAWDQQDSIYTGDLFKPAVFLAAAGIALGLVATLRFSPAGPLVAGLLFLVPAVGLFVDPAPLRNGLPDDFTLAGQAVQVHTPLDNGTLLVLGLLLVVSAVSVQRWRRWPVDETEPETEMLPGPSGESTDPATEPLTVPSGSSPWHPSAPAPSASTPRAAGDEMATTPWRLSTAEPTERLSPAPSAPSAPAAQSPSSAPPPWPPREPAERASTADSPWAGPPARRDDTG